MCNHLDVERFTFLYIHALAENYCVLLHECALQMIGGLCKKYIQPIHTIPHIHVELLSCAYCGAHKKAQECINVMNRSR